MGDPLFERYKAALRAGHLAALRGRLDDALVAYAEAASIAPGRSLPQTSLGGVLRRLERVDEALAAFERAVGLAPADVDAIAGRAEAMAALGRHAGAAEAFVGLAEIHDGEGRHPEALAAARLALEFAELGERRSGVGRLVGRLRGGVGDHGTAEIERRARRIVNRSSSLEPDAARESRAATAASAASAAAAATATASDADETQAAILSAEPASFEPPPGRPDADPRALIADAEARLDDGDTRGALDAYLGAAAALGRDGQWRAALDACSQALTVAPADGRLHLQLAELYLAAGWIGLAAEKVRLVARVAEMDGDAATTARVCAIVKTSFADDPALTALCA